jgi:hypothetical protein
MMGTNTVSARWGAKVDASMRRKWQLIQNGSNEISQRIAGSYLRFAKRSPREPRNPR